MPHPILTRCLFAALAVLFATPIVAADRPNVLLIYIDDLRPQTFDYGHAHMQTPNFTRLAKSGVRFQNAYCQVPTCGASRASLMTSLYPTRTRFPNFLTWAERDAPGVKTLPQRFKEAGYTTIGNGKVFHHRPDTEKRSWSEPAWRPQVSPKYYNEATAEWMKTNRETRQVRGKTRVKVPMWEAGEVEPIETHDGKIATKTMRDLERMAKEKKRFFIACGFYKPHMPFYAPSSMYAKYPLKQVALAEHRRQPQPQPKSLRSVREQHSYIPVTLDLTRRVEYNTPEYHRRMRQGYYASVSLADDLTGKLLDKLEELDLKDNTHVVVIGDHGWLLGEHNQWAKNTLLHDALRTAMWMTGPGIVSDAVVPSHVEFVDIHPTLCELAGISIPEGSIHGRSFASVLKTPDATHREDAYTRFGPGDALSSEKYHYVLYRLPNGKEEALLIDRIRDPLETTNVSGDPAYKEIEANLRKRVLERIETAEARQVK